MIRVITTFSRNDWENYVHDLLPNSIKWWPSGVKWQVWLDDETYAVEELKNLEGVELRFLDELPEHTAFMERWAEKLSRNPDLQHKITKERYPVNYQLDAGTFCHKVFALTSEQAREGAEWLIYLDADVKTLRPLDKSYLTGLLRGDVVHLGRIDMRASDSAFVGVNVGFGSFGNAFLDALLHLYVTDDVYNYIEWTDAYLVNRLAIIMDGMGAKVTNLSKGFKGIEVFNHSPLGWRLYHGKGPQGKKKLMETIK